MLVDGGFGAAMARVRMAWPLALAMAGATAFIVYAVPTATVETGIAQLGVDALTAHAVPFDGGRRSLLALGLALLSGGAVWALFDRLERPERPTKVAPEAEIDLFATEDAAPPRPVVGPPDAVVRRPLFAASDLGTPMDDVERGSTPFGRPPLFHDTPPPLAISEAGHDASGPTASQRAPADPELSLSEVMRRLERGVARRGGIHGAGRPQPDQTVSNALTSLRRSVSER